MNIYTLLTINKKGEVIKTVTGISCATLKLYALKHEKKSQSHVIIDNKTYEIKAAFLWGGLPNENNLTGKHVTEINISKDVIDQIVTPFKRRTIQ